MTIFGILGKYALALMIPLVFAGCKSDAEIQEELLSMNYARIPEENQWGAYSNEKDLEGKMDSYDFFAHLGAINDRVGIDRETAYTAYFPDWDGDGQVLGFPAEYKFDPAKNQFVSISD